MTSAPSSPQQETHPPFDAAAAAQLAREQLGKRSEAVLADPQALEQARQAYQSRRVDLLDAVLSVVHAHLGGDRELDDEFTAFFSRRLERAGKQVLPSRSTLRRMYDTCDLVNSVFRDITPDLARLEFWTRRQFLALLVQRVDWKARDKSRGLNNETRREDMRVVMPPANEIPAALEVARQPLGESIRNEELHQLFTVVQQLQERDREIILMHLKEHSAEEIAEALGMTYQAACKARKRAIDKVSQLLKRSEKRAARADDTDSQKDGTSDRGRPSNTREKGTPP